MKNEKTESVYLNLDFEHLLSNLYGKSTTHGIVGMKDKTTWLKTILKVLSSIEKAINQSIETNDINHKNELSFLCYKTKENVEKASNINSINLEVISGLVKIIFILLGQMPNNWFKKIVNRPDSWKLNDFRTIIYTQNYTQKANLIIYLSDKSAYNEGLPHKNDLNLILYKDFQNNNQKFVDWFKQNYPNNYLKMF